MLGRVFGLYGTAAFTASAVAYMLAGLLLDATSPRARFVIAGVATFAVLLVAGVPLVTLSRRPLTPPPTASV
jgi:MFS-type transporter involved in bile tolerance (Atg22 family)